MFHLAAYSAQLAIGATDADIAAAPDTPFSPRNSHLIFSERYKILAAFANGVGLSRVRFNMPSLNVLGRQQIWPVEQSATIPDWPGFYDCRDYPIDLPMREELALEGTNTDAAAQQANVFLWLGDSNWNRNLPRGTQRITIRATGAVAGVANKWSGTGVITAAENLRGGYYTLVGAQCFDAGTLALRFAFPRGEPSAARQYRPGILCQEAIANSPLKENMGGFGPLGAFDSDELPQIEIFANATAASVQEMRLDLIYHGNNRPEGYF